MILETIGDKYITVSRKSMKTSEAYRYSSANVTTVQVNVNEEGDNMLGDAANETSIAFDPTDNNIVKLINYTLRTGQTIETRELIVTK
jgi:hypothetical protein